jgi:peptidoglycan/LPS O-acetylase OafA/YrhL
MQSIDLASQPAAPHLLIQPKYRADIDGLRAVAVLLVVAFHAFPNWVPSGFMGVDVFFVISGFLISTILFENLAKNRFSFREFYQRRIRRIFPALLTVLLATLAFGWFVLLSDEGSQLGKHTAGGTAFIANLILWSESGYFDTAAETKPLLHLWSLGIEEQFYIVWPLLLWLAFKRGFGMLALTVVVAIASFAWNIWQINSAPIATFYSPFTRVWELLAGSCLAWLTLTRPGWNQGALTWQRQVQSLAGFVLLGLGIWQINRDLAFPGWWAVLPVAGSVLIISGGPQALLNRVLLSNRLMVWFGLISFPLYLWHWPLLAFVRIVEGPSPLRNTRLVAVAAAILLAWLTYRLIEKPVRSGLPGKPVVPALALAMSGVFVIGTLAMTGAVKPRHVDPALAPVMAAISDWEYPNGLRTEKFAGQTFYTSPGGPATTVFFGDSHVEQYSPRILELARTAPGLVHTTVFASVGGCPPVPNFFQAPNPHEKCSRFTDASLQYIAREEVTTVVVGGCWNCYFIDEKKPPLSEPFRGSGPNALRDSFRGREGSELALHRLGDLLKSLATTKKVYLLLDNPLGPAYDPRSYVAGSRFDRMSLQQNIPKSTALTPEMAALQRELKAVADAAGVSVIDPVAHLCPAGICEILGEQGEFVYRDDHHLRPFYVRKRANYLDVVLLAPH